MKNEKNEKNSLFFFWGSPYQACRDETEHVVPQNVPQEFGPYRPKRASTQELKMTEAVKKSIIRNRNESLVGDIAGGMLAVVLVAILV
jgi:hypothetical protein